MSVLPPVFAVTPFENPDARLAIALARSGALAVLDGDEILTILALLPLLAPGQSKDPTEAEVQTIIEKFAAKEAAFARAKLQYQQSQSQIRALELTVATEVTNAALQVESTLRRMEAARAARELQEKRLENEQSKFEVGMSTNFFVVQAQRDLLDSQITELRATLDYQKALVEFERVQLASR